MNNASSTSASGTPAAEVHLQPVPADDHRRFARKACKLQAHLTVVEAWEPSFGETRTFDVVVRNISRSGACFVFFRQLYPDDLVTLDFGDLRRSYRVARCRRLAASCYEVGAAVVG